MTVVLDLGRSDAGAVSTPLHFGNATLFRQEPPSVLFTAPRPEAIISEQSIEELLREELVFRATFDCAYFAPGPWSNITNRSAIHPDRDDETVVLVAFGGVSPQALPHCAFYRIASAPLDRSSILLGLTARLPQLRHPDPQRPAVLERPIIEPVRPEIVRREIGLAEARALALRDLEAAERRREEAAEAEARFAAYFMDDWED